jgi:hypothetical protein
MKKQTILFQHNKIHKEMWISPDGQIPNQTDHVLVNHRKCSQIQDVKTMCEPNCESDHYLVKTVVKEKFIMIPNNYV